MGSPYPSFHPPLVVLSSQDVNTLQTSLRHPIVHYVFAGETDPLIGEARSIIVEMSAEGDTVASIRSLCPEWMVTGVKQSSMNASVAEAHDHVLTIEGLCLEGTERGRGRDAAIPRGRPPASYSRSASNNRSTSRGRQSQIGPVAPRDESVGPGRVIVDLVKDFKARNAQLARVLDVATSGA